MNITGWGIFWLFAILYFLIDTGLYLKGHNTFFWSYKTKAEIELQYKKLGLDTLKECSMKVSEEPHRQEGIKVRDKEYTHRCECGFLKDFSHICDNQHGLIRKIKGKR
jgi:hypothetical protein